jgi:hypothetical protein
MILLSTTSPGITKEVLLPLFLRGGLHAGEGEGQGEATERTSGPLMLA